MDTLVYCLHSWSDIPIPDILNKPDMPFFRISGRSSVFSSLRDIIPKGDVGKKRILYFINIFFVFKHFGLEFRLGLALDIISSHTKFQKHISIESEKIYVLLEVTKHPFVSFVDECKYVLVCMPQPQLAGCRIFFFFLIK